MFNVPRSISKLTCIVLAAGLISIPALGGSFVFISDKAKNGLEPRSGPFKTMLVHPDADLRDYSGVAIGSVGVKPRDKKLAKSMSGADRSELARAFRKEFADGLGDRLASNRKEGTLVLRAAITYAWPNQDVTGRYMHSRGAKAAAANSSGVGGAAFEAILKDAKTGKVVAVIADSYEGPSLQANPNLNSRWGDAKDGFRRWGSDLGGELGGSGGS